MSQRYETIHTLPPLLHCADAPILLTSGALTTDRTMGKLLIRLKIRSLSEKRISAVTGQIDVFDPDGRSISPGVPFRYPDLQLTFSEECGQLTPIYLDDPNVRSFAVRSIGVEFEDGSVYADDDCVWEPLPPQRALSERFDAGSIGVYRSVTTQAAAFIPMRLGDLWLCCCGCVNPAAAETCGRCRCRLSQAEKALDPEFLRQKESYRKALALFNAADYDGAQRIFEQLGAFEDAAAKAALCRSTILERQTLELKAQKRKKRNVMIACASVLAVAVLILGFRVFNRKVLVPSGVYREACSLRDEGDYDEAIRLFQSLGSFRDSGKQIDNCRELNSSDDYAKACSLRDEGRYEEAIEAFQALGDFSDSATQINECRYLIAKGKLAESHYDTAAQLFQDLGDYKDSPDMKKECLYQKASDAMQQQHYGEASEGFAGLSGYKDSDEKRKEADYLWACAECESGQDVAHARELFLSLGDYQDSQERLSKFEYRVVDPDYKYNSRGEKYKFEGSVVSRSGDTLVEKYEYNGGVFENVYTLDGRILKESSFYKGSGGETFTYRYDLNSDGTVSKCHEEDDAIGTDGSVRLVRHISVTEYTYQDGRLISTFKTVTYGPYESVTSQQTMKDTYQYDQEGRLVSSHQVRKDLKTGKSHEFDTQYEYRWYYFPDK